MQVYAFKINNYLDIYYYIEAEKAFFNTFDKTKTIAMSLLFGMFGKIGQFVGSFRVIISSYSFGFAFNS